MLKKVTFSRQINVIKYVMFPPRFVGILSYHTQKICVFHLTYPVRHQENRAATAAFNLSLFLFSIQILVQTSATYLLLRNLPLSISPLSNCDWKRSLSSFPHWLYSFPSRPPHLLGRDQHLGGESPDSNVGHPPRAWPAPGSTQAGTTGLSNTCPGRAGRHRAWRQHAKARLCQS